MVCCAGRFGEIQAGDAKMLGASWGLQVPIRSAVALLRSQPVLPLLVKAMTHSAVWPGAMVGYAAWA